MKAVSPGGNVVLTVKAAKEGLTGKTARAAPSATAAIKLPAPPWRNRRKACAWSCAPVDSGLAALHQEVQKHRRTISLLDLAKVVMGSYDRYDLVFMKQENGPDLYHCKHGDGACFISRQEAVKHLWQSTWMPKYYESVEQEVEAPKGDFKAIAKCSLNNELIGPVNWHGYQSALMNLHRTKFANMTFEAFRSKIVTDKSEEAVQAWQEAVSKRTAWKPVREGASEVLLESPAAVEQDFESNHFDECYDVTDKVFVNGAVKKNHLSPGLWAHLIQLSGTTRRHPSMLIPNLCHGLARHHMPIFKWKGNHYTGPARPKAMEEGTVLSDSLMSIATWAANNPGKGVDAMLKELAPVPEQEKATEEEVAQAMEKQQNLVRDLLWLSEQGYILVFSNNTVSRPRTVSAQAPSPKKAPKEKRKPEEKGQEAPATDSAAPEKQKAASSSEAAAAREEASEENSVVTETKEFPSVPAEELPENNIPEEVSAKA